jgi:hypothetical protein
MMLWKASLLNMRPEHWNSRAGTYSIFDLSHGSLSIISNSTLDRKIMQGVDVVLMSGD